MINDKKLEAMGPEAVRVACFKHAAAALAHRQKGSIKKYELACSLLDQCAAVARRLRTAGIAI